MVETLQGIIGQSGEEVKRTVLCITGPWHSSAEQSPLQYGRLARKDKNTNNKQVICSLSD